MKANELKIGNFAIDATGKETKIELTHFAFESDSMQDFEKWKPIPLTEEWLLKFGFGKFFEGDWEKGDFSFSFNESGMKLFMEYGFINPPIKFVHQLQNLYFALTGNELKEL